MPDDASYQAFCDRVCTYIMSYELGIPFQWGTPLPQVKSPFLQEKPLLLEGRLRLAVIDQHIHYYQRTPTGEEYEIQPEGQISWLPSVPQLRCPPATEEQLLATEKLLGFPLPPVLRALYETVANGGFGPGHDGLFGALGCEDQEGWPITTIYLTHVARCQPIDLASCQCCALTKEEGCIRYLADWEIRVPNGYWPERLLPIVHDGCDLYYFLDGTTGCVFFSGSEPLVLRLMGHSLEELFERWTCGDLYGPYVLPKSFSLSPDPFDSSFDPFLDSDF